MKKLLYPLLAVSIIFTACKTEEEGCTDPNAINYNPEIEAYWGCCCCWDIVGSWSGSNTVIDSVYTVSYMGEIIDSLSNSGIREINFTSHEWQSGNEVYYGPTFVGFLSDGIGSVNYNEDNINDTLNYSINGNILMRKTSNDTGYVSFSYFITDEPDEYSPPCPSGTGRHLSLTGEEELEWKEIVDFGNGPIEIDIHLIYSNTLNFLRISGSGPIQN
jgi:hypothetical protein